MWGDFKKFALKGNVVDLAVGVIIGSAFGKIVSSLVADIIMPLLGFLIGKVDFKSLHYHGIMYGNFIQNTFDFFIIAFSIFIFIRLISKLHFKKKQQEIVEEAAVETTEELLKDIRKLLQDQRIK